MAVSLSEAIPPLVTRETGKTGGGGTSGKTGKTDLGGCPPAGGNRLETRMDTGSYHSYQYYQ